MFRAWYSRLQEDFFATSLSSDSGPWGGKAEVALYAREDGTIVEATEITGPDRPYSGKWPDVEDRGLVDRWVSNRPAVEEA